MLFKLCVSSLELETLLVPEEVSSRVGEAHEARNWGDLKALTADGLWNPREASR